MKRITIALTGSLLALSLSANSQTNVFDDIIATSPNHTYLEAAILQEGLEGALQTSPNVTVFAPTDQAFTDLANALNVTVNDILALPNLADILTYHVLGTIVPSSGVTNGAIVQPLSNTNTLKMTVTSTGEVYANQAKVTAVDIMADNGTVHILDAVVLPSETVVDIAIDNAFTSLTAAVVTGELLPALTNPLSKSSVFAPTNQAFDDLATSLGTDLNGVLAHPELVDILLYHVVDGEVLSTNLSNGSVPTLNGQSIMVDLTSGVQINSSNVTIADLIADNGVVHVIDAVLLPSLSELDEGQLFEFNVYPNPASEIITIDGQNNSFDEALILDLNGRVILQTEIKALASIDVSTINQGTYILALTHNGETATQKLRIF